MDGPELTMPSPSLFASTAMMPPMLASNYIVPCSVFDFNVTSLKYSAFILCDVFCILANNEE